MIGESERVGTMLLAMVLAAALLGAGCTAVVDVDAMFAPSDAEMAAGKGIYGVSCERCHGPKGEGAAKLARSRTVLGDPDRLVEVVLGGVHGPVTDRSGVERSMPGKGHLGDAQLAAVLTYVRNSFGNAAPPVKAKTVARVRAGRAG